MLDFKREVISGAFNNVTKKNDEADAVSVSVKSQDKNVNVKITEKGLTIAGTVAIASTAICVLGATIMVKRITKSICKKRKYAEAKLKQK